MGFVLPSQIAVISCLFFFRKMFLKSWFFSRLPNSDWFKSMKPVTDDWYHEATMVAIAYNRRRSVLANFRTRIYSAKKRYLMRVKRWESATTKNLIKMLSVVHEEGTCEESCQVMQYYDRGGCWLVNAIHDEYVWSSHHNNGIANIFLFNGFISVAQSKYSSLTLPWYCCSVTRFLDC